MGHRDMHRSLLYVLQEIFVQSSSKRRQLDTSPARPSRATAFGPWSHLEIFRSGATELTPARSVPTMCGRMMLRRQATRELRHRGRAVHEAAAGLHRCQRRVGPPDARCAAPSAACGARHPPHLTKAPPASRCSRAGSATGAFQNYLRMRTNDPGFFKVCDRKLAGGIPGSVPNVRLCRRGGRGVPATSRRCAAWTGSASRT